MKSWCGKHNLNCLDHPQSEASKGKTVVFTVDDHRKLMREGVEIMEDVNADLGEGNKHFHTLGDLEQPKPKSFWFEVKCPNCGDGLMQLCPPKKEFRVNFEESHG